MCKAWFKKDNLDDPCFKLALVPSLGKLNFGLDKKTKKPMLYPIVSVQNVYIFPGISYLEKFSSHFPQSLKLYFRNSRAATAFLHQPRGGAFPDRHKVLHQGDFSLHGRALPDIEHQQSCSKPSSSNLWFLPFLVKSILQNKGTQER